MAKQSGGKPQIDEDFMKEIISQGLPVKKQETPMVAIPTEVKSKAETPDIPANVPEQEPKRETENVKEEKAVKEPARRKNNTPGDYRETHYMRVDLTDRQPLYVSRATHEKLMKIVTVIGGRKATPLIWVKANPSIVLCSSLYPEPLSPPVIVLGLTCTIPYGVVAPGKVLPNP